MWYNVLRSTRWGSLFCEISNYVVEQQLFRGCFVNSTLLIAKAAGCTRETHEICNTDTYKLTHQNSGIVQNLDTFLYCVYTMQRLVVGALSRFEFVLGWQILNMTSFERMLFSIKSCNFEQQASAKMGDIFEFCIKTVPVDETHNYIHCVHARISAHLWLCLFVAILLGLFKQCLHGQL